MFIGGSLMREWWLLRCVLCATWPYFVDQIAQRRKKVFPRGKNNWDHVFPRTLATLSQCNLTTLPQSNCTGKKIMVGPLQNLEVAELVNVSFFFPIICPQLFIHCITSICNPLCKFPSIMTKLIQFFIHIAIYFCSIHPWCNFTFQLFIHCADFFLILSSIMQFSIHYTSFFHKFSYILKPYKKFKHFT